jgi:hypothetical protein
MILDDVRSEALAIDVTPNDCGGIELSMAFSYNLRVAPILKRLLLVL